MSRSTTDLMWADALAALTRAERVHRAFFQPASSGWEPPVDLLETAEELIIVAALPGVRVADVDLVVSGGELAIVGIRRMLATFGPTRVHRMELPHGRLARRIVLPPGSSELARRDLDHGCLTVILRKLA